MSDTPELMSCLFCGSSNINTYVWNDGDERIEYVQCQDCTACGPDHRNGCHWNITVPRNEPDSDAIEDAIEKAYWQFDARRKGYAEWKGSPQSERDAFKAEARALAKGYFPVRRHD